MIGAIHRALVSRASATSLFGAAALLATLGTSQTVISGVWDAISHILREPEHFWSIQHVAVYAGVAAVACSAAIAYALLVWRRESLVPAQRRALALVIAGAILQVVAGHADYVSHEMYGIDGLVSWSHQPLEAGLLASALGGALLLRHAGPRARLLAPVSAMVLVASALWLAFNLFLVANATMPCLAVYKVFSSGCAVM
ncbi:MAG: hypothetical protein OXU86_03885 [Thaumarchaeota archaeon]|nr:hypothetical protein [Nitrososphaerota archaeon]RNJ71306.1 MAG: hypothetical protein EB832_06310 [Thaumarchaeota archaeon S14]RNJ71651.1 MAG: hypothetical protein EB833_06615 [Thaumarchaeota archaeon S13]MDD9808513.1 hypothetical protein [Nitrososphaerota archaeon]MDD9813940.1 hypothetical protein [Nitrososphaerota archaeon]